MITLMQEVISSIVACYCAGLNSLEDASMQARWAKDSIFDAMADALTGSSAVQVAELMMETGDKMMSMHIAHDTFSTLPCFPTTRPDNCKMTGMQSKPQMCSLQLHHRCCVHVYGSVSFVAC